MNVEHHAFLGISGTLQMQERIQALQTEWDTTVYKQARLDGREVPEMKVRCGLHTSPAYVGNMGSPSRMKYGASGGVCAPVVRQGYRWLLSLTNNVSCVTGALATAEKLENINKTYGTLVLVSENTYNQPHVKERVLFRLVDYAFVEPDLDRWRANTCSFMCSSPRISTY